MGGAKIFRKIVRRASYHRLVNWSALTLLAAGALAGCASSADPCDGFPGQTCLSLDVRGSGLSIDQVEVAALTGFTLAGDGRSPETPARVYALPIRLAVLPGAAFAGGFTLQVTGFIEKLVVGADQVNGSVAAGQHLPLIAQLGGANASDLAGVDLIRPGTADLAASDLAGADLLGVNPSLDLAVPSGDLALPHGSFVDESTGLTDCNNAGVFGFGTSLFAACTGLTDPFTVLHSSGDGTWTAQFSVTPNNNSTFTSGVWGTGPNDIYAWGGQNTDSLLVHSTGGGTFSPERLAPDGGFMGAVEGMAGVTSNDVYLIASVQILHAAAEGAWVRQVSTPGNRIFAVQSNALYATSTIDTILVSDGNGQWQPQSTGSANNHLYDVWASTVNDIYVVGYQLVGGVNQALMLHSTGTAAWTPVTNLPANSATWLRAIFGTSATDIWAVGDHGTILHFDGVWHLVPSGLSGSRVLTSVWASSTDVLIGTDGTDLVHLRR